MGKHKHYDMIVAWAEGKTIQSRLNNGDPWVDCSPAWHPSSEYRVKPDPPAYRVAMFNYGKEGGVQFACVSKRDAATAAATEKTWKTNPYFVKWVTDWITQEV